MPRIKARDLHAKAMREDPEYRREYEALEEEFALIAAMLDARRKAGLTQALRPLATAVPSPLLRPTPSKKWGESGEKNPHHAKKG